MIINDEYKVKGKQDSIYKFIIPFLKTKAHRRFQLISDKILMGICQRISRAYDLGK